jgi:tRNA 2-thiouridine synthesizing protein A
MEIMIEVDVKGLSCPIPVVRTKQAMEKNPAEIITVFAESTVS